MENENTNTEDVVENDDVNTDDKEVDSGQDHYYFIEKKPAQKPGVGDIFKQSVVAGAAGLLVTGVAMGAVTLAGKAYTKFANWRDGLKLKKLIRKDAEAREILNEQEKSTDDSKKSKD